MASAMESVELELCPNCKKEIPQVNYVMHTMHCARNISLCPVCKEPIPKGELDAHKEKHKKGLERKSVASTQLGSASTSTSTSSTTTWKSKPYTGPFPEKLGHRRPSDPRPTLPAPAQVNQNGAARRAHREESNGVGSTVNGFGKAVSVPEKPKVIKRRNNDLSPCKYCELELPKDTMKEHEDYCGTRTDRCNECGEFVMFKYKKLHEESNHGFMKLSDEPGPKPSWDSATQRSSSTSTSTSATSGSRRGQYNAFDMSSLAGAAGTLFNMADYLPPSLTSGISGGGGGGSRYTDDSDVYRPSGGIARDPKKIDYKDLSRRLDCKTEYIRNLLHDSAAITAPLRSGATAPRNHFNHHKGPAPQPPAYRRPNPPTELTIPCEFCQTPIPHEDLIQHETGCRPDLARFNPRRRRQEEEFYRYTPSPPPEPAPASPEVELPCEFCSDMIPASQLLRHQATCN